MAGRFTRATHQVVLHCFIRDVFKPLARGRSVTIYEDGFYDPIDYWMHFRRGVFTWHSPSRAFAYGGRKYGSAADLNVSGAERSFFLSTLFPHAARWGIASRFEGGTHAHLDCGGNEAFGDSASLHSRSTHVGRPEFGAMGNPIRIDGAWGANTTRKIQAGSGGQLAVDGNLGPHTIRYVQGRVGVAQDASFGRDTKAALARKVGSKVTPAPGGTNGGNTALQIYLMLNHSL